MNKKFTVIREKINNIPSPEIISPDEVFTHSINFYQLLMIFLIILTIIHFIKMKNSLVLKKGL
ncbi:MAG: hypothetical protein HeimC3_25020 [Candidatus Heimdallarchaeota archaeon LC_3]|nr:MAG: hypothetical protein HeimC3_25020 [Candidatus Heimdallarchaeota archaeon LC_3]